MNGIQAALLDLVRIAESPLYSAYRWLGRELGRELAMTEFLRLVEELVDQEALCLWSVDIESEERTRLMHAPDRLANDYASLGHTDDSFDPFGLSLTLGPAAEPDADPDWEVDLDFESGKFQLDVRAGRGDDALAQVRRLFPDVELLETDHSGTDDHVRISGSVQEMDTESKT